MVMCIKNKRVYFVIAFDLHYICNGFMWPDLYCPVTVMFKRLSFKRTTYG